jgi:hypothetical protein
MIDERSVPWYQMQRSPSTTSTESFKNLCLCLYEIILAFVIPKLYAPVKLLHQQSPPDFAIHNNLQSICWFLAKKRVVWNNIVQDEYKNIPKMVVMMMMSNNSTTSLSIIQ